MNSLQYIINDKNKKALAHLARAQVLLNAGLGFGALTSEDMRYVFDTVIQNDEAMYELNSKDFDSWMGTNKEIRNSCKDFLRKAAKTPKFFIEKFYNDRPLALLLVKYGDFVEMIKPLLNILLQIMKDVKANPEEFLHKRDNKTDLKFALLISNKGETPKYVNIEDRCEQIALIWLLMKSCQSNVVPFRQRWSSDYNFRGVDHGSKGIKDMEFRITYLLEEKYIQSSEINSTSNDHMEVLKALDFICSNKTASHQDWDLIACHLQDMYVNDHEKKCDLSKAFLSAFLKKIEIPFLMPTTQSMATSS